MMEDYLTNFCHLTKIISLSQKMRCVCSCTTIPSRLRDPKLVRVLKRLGEQSRPFDAIYLGIPERSKRFGVEYPEVPPEVGTLCTVVRLPEDYGPISKILAGLLRERDPETAIVTCDDDILYPTSLVEELLASAGRSPNSAICFTGLNLGRFPGYVSLVLNYDFFDKGWWFNIPVGVDGVPVDILMGYSGVLYRRAFFPATLRRLKSDLLDYTERDKNVFIHDDVLLSAYLSSQDIERRAFIFTQHVENTYMPGALSGNTINLKFIMAFFKAVSACRSWGYLRNLQPTNPLRTVTGPLFVIVVFIIVVLLVLL